MTTIQNAGGGDWLDLPTKPVPHRGRTIPLGLPWAELTANHVAAGGQVDSGVWHKGNVKVIEAGRRGSERIHTFVEDEHYQESASPAPKRGARHRKPVQPDSVTAAAAKPRVTLSDEARAEIASRYAAGEHMPELAAAFGVGVGSVSWALKIHGVKTRSQAEARALAKTRNAS
jgi:hypothetical protein